jgi:LemA protein
MGKAVVGCGLVILVLVLVLGLFGVGAYNNLVTLDQAVQAQWGQVQNVY